MQIRAMGKINLTLYVLGRRPDGYHNLELIFQPVSLADILEVEELTGGEGDLPVPGENAGRKSGILPAGEDRSCGFAPFAPETAAAHREEGIVFTCSRPEFVSRDNLVCRGLRKMRERFPGRIPPLRIHLIKNIPSGAGMGGGSTDCSALLVWLNHTYHLGISREEMIRTGAALGADVPACMIPHAVLGHGIGERLTDIDCRISVPLLLVKPPVSFSTAEMYRRVDRIAYYPAANGTGEMVRAMEQGDVSGMAGLLYNIFEEAVPEPDFIQNLRQELLDAGALGSRMTGSGSVVYGMFADGRSRDRAAGKLSARIKAGVPGLAGCRIYSCETVNEVREW